MRSAFTACFFLLMAVTSKAQYQDAIVGKWLSADGDGKVEIYKKGDKYYGKLVWLKEPNEDNGTPKVDDENPDASKRSTP